MLEKEDIIGLARYYVARIDNPLFMPDSVLHREEFRLCQMLTAQVGDVMRSGVELVRAVQEVDLFMKSHQEILEIEAENAGLWLETGLKVIGILSGGYL